MCSVVLYAVSDSFRFGPQSRLAFIYLPAACLACKTTHCALHTEYSTDVEGDLATKCGVEHALKGSSGVRNWQLMVVLS